MTDGRQGMALLSSLLQRCYADKPLIVFADGNEYLTIQVWELNENPEKWVLIMKWHKLIKDAAALTKGEAKHWKPIIARANQFSSMIYNNQ